MLPTHGILEKLIASDELDENVAEILIDGYTVLPSLLSSSLLESLKKKLENIYSQQILELGGDEETLLQMQDADIVRCPLSFDLAFLDVAASKNLMKFSNRLLGSNHLLIMQNGILNRGTRKNYQISWHRDLNYQHFTSSKPLAINALLCLSDFNTENGATFVLPGTQHIESFPTEKYVSNHEKQVIVPSGSFLILDAMLYHRAGINQTINTRYAINQVIGLPFMAQQINIPSAVKKNNLLIPQDPIIQKFLGVRWSPSESALDWRQRRMNKS